MTVDDVPMDELDLAIRREALALRDHIASSTQTDADWDDFTVARTATIIPLRHSPSAHHGRRVAVAVAAVAVLVVALWLTRQTRDESPVRPPSSGYTVVVQRGGGGLFAIGADGQGRPFTRLPLPLEAGATFDVSTVGWVAEARPDEVGLWVYDLRDQIGTRRFVPITLAPGEAEGSWSPDGTSYTIVDSGGSPVIVHIDTGIVTRLPGTDPPFGAGQGRWVLADLVDRLPTPVEEGAVASIEAVAPDDSAVILRVDGPGLRRAFHLLPADGSPGTELDGDFAGFVLTSAIESISST